MHSALKQRQRILPIQSRRFSLLNLPLNHTVKDKFQKSVKYVDPLVVYRIVDPHNYLLMTLDGQLVRGLFEHERLKPAMINTNQGNVKTLSTLKKAMNLEITPHNNLTSRIHIFQDQKPPLRKEITKE